MLSLQEGAAPPSLGSANTKLGAAKRVAGNIGSSQGSRAPRPAGFTATPMSNME